MAARSEKGRSVENPDGKSDWAFIGGGNSLVSSVATLPELLATKPIHELPVRSEPVEKVLTRAVGGPRQNQNA
jgi:hypothetical protein